MMVFTNYYAHTFTDITTQDFIFNQIQQRIQVYNCEKYLTVRIQSAHRQGRLAEG